MFSFLVKEMISSIIQTRIQKLFISIHKKKLEPELKLLIHEAHKKYMKQFNDTFDEIKVLNMHNFYFAYILYTYETLGHYEGFI